ncbi:SPOR domain-containing protein [Marinomonas profundimaris]|uniref:Sporulation protein n=1 Tax=Marinomonas profundimaris TaxID=1208321 RepID=W1S5F6_9GAMM|nr:SPOR domain-containing protein [Marinomonas profundimaris]ETI62313.1 sporulation protein [Marinomonas profundimaris]
MGMSKKLIIVVAGLSLGACSSTGGKNTFMNYGDLQEKVRAHDEQWESVQSKLDRIDALEAEVAALKQDKMSGSSSDMTTSVVVEDDMLTDESMAAIDVAPAVTQAPLNDSVNAAPMADMNADLTAVEPVVVAPVVTAPMAKKTSEYGVQVASYGNRDEAVRGWKVLLKAYPTSFDGLTPLVNQKDVNGRMMYQLKVGPFVEKSYSSDFCKMLKEKGKDCLVTQYNGDAFATN